MVVGVAPWNFEMEASPPWFLGLPHGTLRWNECVRFVWKELVVLVIVTKGGKNSSQV
jgi:hypothetical protein